MCTVPVVAIKNWKEERQGHSDNEPEVPNALSHVSFSGDGLNSSAIVQPTGSTTPLGMPSFLTGTHKRAKLSRNSLLPVYITDTHEGALRWMEEILCHLGSPNFCN